MGVCLCVGVRGQYLRQISNLFSIFAANIFLQVNADQSKEAVFSEVCKILES